MASRACACGSPGPSPTPVCCRLPSGTSTRRPGWGWARALAVRQVKAPSPAGTFSATAKSSLGGVVFFLRGPANALGLENLEARRQLARGPQLHYAREPLRRGGIAVLEEAHVDPALADQACRGGGVLVEPELRPGQVARPRAQHVDGAVFQPRERGAGSQIGAELKGGGPEGGLHVCGRKPAVGEEGTDELQELQCRAGGA